MKSKNLVKEVSLAAVVEHGVRGNRTRSSNIWSDWRVYTFGMILVGMAVKLTWFLTGSQEAPLMQGVTESMAGRAAILQLMPFSIRESSRVNLLYGGYPEVLARPSSMRLWHSSYLQTYLERDVQAITVVRDLATYRRLPSD